MKKTECTNIYEEEMEKSINSLKNFREAWLRSSSKWNAELFQYTDSDYYFYSFAVRCQEKNTEPLLTRILDRLMQQYNTPVLDSDEIGDVPFVFVICKDGKKIGYRFDDFYEDEDVNEILQACGIDLAIVLRTWKAGRPDKWIAMENNVYQEKNVNLRGMSIEAFFKEYFGEEEYNEFLTKLEEYLQRTKSITGYKPIKYLSSMNLAAQKAFEEKLLADWDYMNYKYQILDKDNEAIKKDIPKVEKGIPEKLLSDIFDNYVKEKVYKTMVGKNEYAVSFITSEWLFHSLEGAVNFDYTSIISGYLKSIEQLLYQIVMFNINNGCKITMSGDNDNIEIAKQNDIVVYKWQKNKGLVKTTIEFKGFKYIDFIETQKQYMDSSIGTFQYFLINNPHIFINPKLAGSIAAMISCFREECRNTYFHTHNLDDWDIVKTVRSNAIYLYFALLGSCKVLKEKYKEKLEELKILPDDRFDNLCKQIREFQHYYPQFIFEYADGKRKKLIYDFFKNTIEYAEDGTEHYESLLFYEVEDFEWALEQLDEGIREEQKVYLTRDNLPMKIYGFYKNHEQIEIEF